MKFSVNGEDLCKALLLRHVECQKKERKFESFSLQILISVHHHCSQSMTPLVGNA